MEIDSSGIGSPNSAMEDSAATNSPSPAMEIDSTDLSNPTLTMKSSADTSSPSSAMGDSTGTSSPTPATNGSLKLGNLRNFRKDVKVQTKPQSPGQLSLLRFFRPGTKKPDGDQGSKSPSSTNSSDTGGKPSTPIVISSSSISPVVNSASPVRIFTTSSSSPLTPGTNNSLKGIEAEVSPVFKRRISTDKPPDGVAPISIVTSTQPQSTVKLMVQKSSSTVSLRTFSRPLFVGAPSPERKQENDNDGDKGDSTSESPLGGVSMKTLINKTSPVKRTLSSSDLDDSQDSPLFRTKVVKRPRLVASSDEDEAVDKKPRTDEAAGKKPQTVVAADKKPQTVIGADKKPQTNGHSWCADEKKPEDDTIEKFLDMWEMVYPFVDRMELLDVYKGNDWDAKITMIQLNKTNKERRDKERQARGLDEQDRKKQTQNSMEVQKAREEKKQEERLKRIEAEMDKKREAEEKKEELKKQRMEREKQNRARNAVKLKLKEKKASWKAKTSGKQSEQDVDDEGEDFQMSGANVYDSDEDSDTEESPMMKGDRQLVLQFFNESGVGELAAIGGCSRKKAEMLMQLRPFADWDDIVQKFQTEKYVSTDLLNEAKTVLHLRTSVNKLMKKCEDIAKDMQSIVSRIVNGEEDAGISKQPDSLNSSMQLKGYQLIGLNWLVLMHEQGLNGVLADEMGLGKTVQAISFLAYIKEVEDPERQSLIVVPSSTLDNWARELETWCPALEVLHYHGSLDDRRSIRTAILNSTLDHEPDVILTTYNMVTTSTEDRALFKKMRFHSVILDEAHMLKNMASLRYENLMKIKAYRRILLTGTPLQNNLVELMSILIFVMPQLFDSKKEELKKVFSMFPKGDSSGNKGRFERERIEQAKRIMKPFFLRRLKCDVLKDLPVKRDEVISAPMSKRQNEIYAATVAVLSKKAQQQKLELERVDVKKLSEVEELKRTSGSGKVKPKERDTGSNMVMELRKIANHPLLVRRHYTDAKLKEISKILKRTSHRDSVLEYIIEDFSVMSDFEIHNTCCQFRHIRNHKLSDDVILSSGKMEQLDVLLPKLKEEGARVLLFSQFVIVLDVLEQYVKLRGHRYLRFDGTTQVSERQELIDQYTEDDDIFLFLLSTKAGGLGINLTAANTVILHDIDFNPYNDKQAEDRCHRVGQTRPVKIIRLISKNTIEEGMLQIAREKLQLERDVTGLEEEQQKRDVGMLLKAALGLVKLEAPTSSSTGEKDESQNAEGDSTAPQDEKRCEDSEDNDTEDILPSNESSKQENSQRENSKDTNSPSEMLESSKSPQVNDQCDNAVDDNCETSDSPGESCEDDDNFDDERSEGSNCDQSDGDDQL